MKLLQTTTALAIIFSLSAELNAQSTGASSRPPVQSADSNTNLDVASNGTPIVNIATPDKNGTSFNRFNRFNVNREGLIINNSKEIGQSVLGGFILANPNLRDSSNANLILAEVVSSNRSDLFGPIEIFGPQANFILANEAGITCDGCGFINISRVALSTGKITFGTDGSFSGFDTSQGSVRVEGDGLLAGNVDFFDIITSSAEINANLFARDLSIIGGNGQYDFASGTITETSNYTPRIVIDSSQLGGMFANRIRLVGTGNGVGINLTGAVSSLEGTLEITSGGDISLSSAISAGNLNIESASGDINIAERLFGSGNVTIDAGGNISNEGDFIAASGDINITSGSNINLNSDGVFAGLSTNGVLDQTSNLTIDASGDINLSATQIAATEQTIVSGNIVSISEGSQVSSADLSLFAVENLNALGTIQSQNNLQLSSDSIDIAGSAIANTNLELVGNNIIISGDAIGLTSIDISASEEIIVDADGSIQTNQVLNLNAGNINNSGRILGVDTLDIAATGVLNNDGSLLTGGDINLITDGNIDSSGIISANGNVSILTDADISIKGLLAATNELSLDAGNIDVDGQISTSGVLNVSSNNISISEDTVIVSDRDLELVAGNNLSSNGTISTSGQANIIAGENAQIAGQVLAGEDIAISAVNIDVIGSIITNDELSISASEAVDISGTLSADNTLSIAADLVNLTQNGRLVSNNDIGILALDNIINSAAISGQNISLDGRNISNDGIILATSALSVNASEMIAQTGVIESSDILSLSADNIILDGRNIGVGGLDINAVEISLSEQNDIQSGARLSLTSSEDLNLLGNIISVDIAEISTSGSLIQQANIGLGSDGFFGVTTTFENIGDISAVGSLKIFANTLNIGANISANRNIDLIALENIISIEGAISTSQVINIDASDIINVSGSLVSSDRIALLTNKLQISGSINAGMGIDTSLIRELSISERASLLSGDILSLNLNHIENAGLILGSSGIDISAVSDFINIGQIISDQDLTIVTQGSFSNLGLLQSAVNLSIDSNDNQLLDGSIIATNDARFNASELNIVGNIITDGQLILSGKDIAVASGAIAFSGTTLLLDAVGDISNVGLLSSNGDVRLVALGDIIQSGNLESVSSIVASGQSIDLSGTTIALGDISLGAAGNINVTDNLSSQGSASLNALNIIIGADGQLGAEGFTSLRASGFIDIDGVISSAQPLSIISDRLQSGIASIIASDNNIDIIANSVTHLGALQSQANINIDTAILDVTGVISSAATIILDTDAFTLDGSLASNAGIIGRFDSVIINGNLSSQGAITLDIISDIQINALSNISSDNALSITADSAHIDGVLSSSDLLSIDIANALDIDGDISAASNINLSASTLSSNAIFLSNAIITIDTIEDTRLAGRILAGEDIIIRSALADISADLTANQNILVDAAAINIVGNISASGILGSDNVLLGGNITLASTQGVIIDGNIVSNDSLSLSAAGTINIRSNVEAGGLLGLEADHLIIDGLLRGGSNTTLALLGDVTLNGSLEAIGDLSFTANALQSATTSQLLTNGSLDIDLAGDAILSGLISADSIALDTPALVQNIGTIFSANDLTLTAQAIANNAVLVGLLDVNFDAQSIISGSDSDIRSGANLAINAVEQLNISGSIASVGDTHLSSLASLNQNANITSGGTTSLTASGVLVQNADILSTGALDVTGASIIGIGNLTSNAQISLNTLDADIDYQGNASALGDINFLSAGRLILSGAVNSNGLLNLSAADVFVNGALVGIGGVTINDRVQLAVGALGEVRSGAGLSLDLTSLNNAGLITANRALNINSTLNIINDGIIVSSDTLSLSANNITNNATVQSNATLLLDAISDISNAGLLSSNGDMRLVALGDIIQSGNIESVKSLSINATSDVIVDAGAQLVAEEGLTISADNIINSGLLLSQDMLVLTTNQNIDNIGDIQSVGVQSINANSIETEGAIVSLSTVIVNSASSLNIGGELSAADSITINAQNIDVAATGMVLSGAAINIEVDQSATNFGIINGSDISIMASNFNNVNELAATTDINLIVTDLFDNSGVLEANGQLDIDTNKLLLTGTVLGLNGLEINAQDISAIAGSRILSGANTSIFAANNSQFLSEVIANDLLSITVGNDLTIEGILSANNDITLTANREIRLDADTRSTAEINLTANSLRIGGNLTANSNVNIESLLGGIIFTGEVNTLGAINIISVDQFDHNGIINAETNISILSNSVNIDGSLLGLSNLSIVSNDNIVSGANSSILSNGNITLESKNLDIAGLLQTTDILSITTINNVNIAGEVLASNDLNLLATNATITGNIQSLSNFNVLLSGGLNILNTGQILSGESLSITAQQNIFNAGVIGSNSDLSLRSDERISITGTLQSIDDLSVVGNMIDVLGNISTDSQLSVNTSGNLTISGSVTALGTGHIAAVNLNVDTIITDVPATLFSSEDLEINVVNNINNSGVLGSDANLDLIYNGVLNNSGTLITGNAFTLSTVNNLILGGSVLAGDSITINARDINVNGLLIGDAGLVANGRTITIASTGALRSGIDVAVIASEDLEIAGDILAINNVDIDVQNNINLIGTGSIEAGQNLDIVSRGNILSSTLSNVTANGMINVNSVNATFNGSLISNSSIVLNTLNNIGLFGVSSAGSGFSATFNELSLSNQLVSNGIIDLNGNHINVDGDILSNESITITALESINTLTDSLISAEGNLTFSALGQTLSGRLESNTDITVLASNTINIDGEILSVQNLSIISEDLDVIGDITGLGSVDINANDTIISGSIRSAGILNLDVDSLSLSGLLSASNVLDIQTGTIDAILGSLILSDDNIIINSSENSIFSGLISSDANINIGVVGSILFNSEIESKGAINITSDSVDTTSISSFNTDSSINIVSNNGVSISGELSADGNIDINGLNISLSGIVISNNDITISSLDDIFADNIIGTAGSIELNFNGDFTQNAGLISAGQSLILSGGGTAGVNGIFEANGTIDIEANTVIINDVVRTASGLNILSDNTSLNGSILADNAILTANLGNITVGNLGRINTVKEASLIAQSNIIVDGVISTGLSDNISGDGVILNAITGSVSIGNAARVATLGNVVLNAGVSFTNFATGKDIDQNNLGIEALGNVDVNVSDGIITTGQILSDNNISLVAADSIEVIGEVNASNNINLNAGLGNIEIVNNAALRSQNGNVTIATDNVFENKGTIATASGLSINAVTSLINDSTIFTANGDLSLSANTLQLSGFIFSTGLSGALLLNSDNIDITGIVASDNALVINNLAGQLNVAQGGVLQSNSSLDLDLASINIIGTLRTIGDASINFGLGTFASDGIVEADGLLSLNTTGQLSLLSNITATSDIEINAASLLQDGVILSNGGRLSINTNNDSFINGSITSSGILSIDANSIALNSDSQLISSNIINIISDDEIVSSGTVRSIGNINFLASNDITIDNILASNNNVGLTASNGDISVGGPINSGGSIDIVGNNVVINNSIIANDNIIIASHTNDIVIDGDIDAGVDGNGILSLTANNGNILVASGNEIFGQDAVSINANSITVDGSILSPTDVDLISSSSDIEISGVIIGQGSVSLAAISGNAQNVLLNGRIDGGDIDIVTDDFTVGGAGIIRIKGTTNLKISNAATINGVIVGDTDIIFNGNIAQNSNLNIGSTGTLQSLNSSIILNNISGLQVDGIISANNNISIDYADSLNISNDGRVEAIGIDDSGNITGGDIFITHIGASGITDVTINIDGELVGSRDINIVGGVTDIDGFVFANRNLNITSDDFTLDANNIASSLTIGDTGILAAGNNANVNVTGSFNIDTSGIESGYFYADGDVVINALSNNIEGDIFASGSILFTNGNNITGTAAPLYGFNLGGSVQSGQSININTSARDVNIQGGGTLVSDGQVLVTGNAINTSGTVAANNLVEIVSIGNINLGGLIQSGGQVFINAGDSIHIADNSNIETTGDVSVINNIQSIFDIAGNQIDNINITFQAINDIINAGTIFSDGSIVFNSDNANVINQENANITSLDAVLFETDNGDTLNSGTVSASRLFILQSEDFVNSGNFVADGSLFLSAPNISNSGLIAAGIDLTLNAVGEVDNIGTIFAGGDLNIIAGTNIHNDEGLILSAFGNIDLTAPELLNESARIEALAGGITINSENIINRIKTLVIDRGADATEAGFVLINPNTGLPGSTIVQFDDRDCDNLNGGVMCSGGNPITSFTVQTAFLSTFSGSAFSPGVYKFRDATVNGDIIRENSGAAEIIATDNIVINGGNNGFVVNSNSSILAGNNISITTGTLNNIADVVTFTRSVFPNNFVTICRQGDGNGGCSEPDPVTVEYAIEKGITRRCGGNIEANCIISGSVIPVTETVMEGLPTLIQAAGTVSITANQLGNGVIVDNNIVMGSGDTSPNTNLSSASTIGNRPSFIEQPDNDADATVNNIGLNNVGPVSTAIAIDISIDNTIDNNIINQSTAIGNGAETVTGNTITTAIGGETVAINIQGADDISNFVVNVPNTVEATVNDLTSNSINNVEINTNINIVDMVDSQNNDDVIIVVDTVETTADIDNSRKSIDQTSVSNQVSIAGLPINNSQAIDTNMITDTVNSEVTANAINIVGGFNGVDIDTVQSQTINSITNADTEVTELSIGEALDVQNNLDIPDAILAGDPSTSSELIDSAELALLADGFNGIAINNIISSDGEAGAFILNFLDGFDLITQDNGFGFANGNGLFTFNDRPNADFLFSTNPGLSDIGALFDSDFFFEQLNIDRDTFFIRLGDGFFETQFISQQVQEATNQALLPQFGSSLEQAESLFQAGIDQQEALGLELGVALTSEQVAQLTTSIVYYVTARVADRNVLVPVLYLSNSDQKQLENGSLIAGNNVIARIAGDINNQGIISGDNILSITAGNDVVNAEGGVIRGGTVIASAAHDIINRGASSIEGNDILLSAGRDISIIPISEQVVTSSSKSIGKRGFDNRRSEKVTVIGGSVIADNNLVINAGRDIDIVSSTVGASGDTVIEAGRNIVVTGESNTASASREFNKDRKRLFGTRRNNGETSNSSSNFVGSTVAVEGNLSVSAGDNILIKGSEIAAVGNLGIEADGDINIEAGQSTSNSNVRTHIRNIKTRTARSSLINETSNISAGGNLVVVSSSDINIVGSNLAAGNIASVDATNIDITGVIDVATENSEIRVKKSGFLSSKRTTTTTNIVDETAIISSIEGDQLFVNADRDISIIGSNAVATNDINISAGGSINIGALTTTDITDQTIKVKRSGLSFSGGALFAGVSKNENTSENSALTNIGSLIGSAQGDVRINANDILNVAGSQIIAPGSVDLIGRNVDIVNVTDVTTGRIESKSSSFGVTARINSPILSGVQAITNTARIAATTDSDRTRAVAGLAGGLAAINTFDAVGKVGKLSNLIKDPLQSVSVSVSVGFSKSRNETNTVDETVVGSSVTGGDVNIISTGDGTDGAINIKGSRVEAGRDLILAAQGPITIASAQEIDTLISENSSSGISVGVTIGAGLLTPNASVNFGKGNSAGKEVTNIESILSAGNIATISTPNDLTLQGAIIEADSVAIDVGALTIRSEQDTADFRSRQRSIGLSASLNLGKDAVKANPATNTKGRDATSTSGTAGFNFGSSKEDGRFASVAEQSGIIAGEGGFDIKVRGATELEAAIIASSAAAQRNRLETGTLTSKDLVNVEEFSASSTNLSASLSGIGAKKGAEKPSVGSDENGQVDATNSGKGVALPGLATALGTITAGAPQALGASGDQKGTSSSAIANGTILITSGDAASQEVADSISRDTEAANGGALTQEFDEARRAEIQEGFAVTKELIAQTSIFFANRATEEKEAKEKADAVEEELERLKVERSNYPIDSEEYQILSTQISPLQQIYDEPARLNGLYGSGSPARIIATALTGAAGGNAAGGLGDLVRASAANVLQSLAVSEIKDIADSLRTRQDNDDGTVTITDNETSETVRTLLQGILACGGSQAGGQGDCGSAALGASSAAVINALIASASGNNSFTASVLETQTGDGRIGNSLTLEEQQARVNLVSTILTGIASVAGLDVASATTAARIETENNSVRDEDGNIIFGDPTGDSKDFHKNNLNVLAGFERTDPADYRQFIAGFGGNTDDAKFKAALFLAYSSDEFLNANGGQKAVISAVNQSFSQLLNIVNPDRQAHLDLLWAAGRGRGDGGPDIRTTQFALDQLSKDTNRPSVEQLDVVAKALLSGDISSSEVSDFVNFYGGADEFANTGQNPLALASTFNETKQLLETEGYQAFSTLPSSSLSKYYRGEQVSPDEEKQIALAISYIDYRSRINRDLTPQELEDAQRWVDVVNELRAGNVLNGNAGSGAANSLIDAANFVIYIADGITLGLSGNAPTSNGEYIPRLNPCTGSNDTPACRAQADIGYVGGSAAQLFIPAGWTGRLAGLRKTAGLTDEAAAVINASDDAARANRAALDALAPAPTPGQLGANQIIIRAPGTEVSGSALEQLAARGVKISPENVIATGRDSTGRIVWLEVGTATGPRPAGLAHITDRHASEFATIGVSEAQIPAFLLNAVKNGRIVGYQGRDKGRAIYEVVHNGVRQRVAITVGDNGFIVGANPAGRLQ